MLRAFGAHIGSNVRIHPVRVMNAHWRNLRIEDDCYVGPDVLLDLADRLTLRKGAVVAVRAALMTHQDAGEAHGSPTTALVPTFSAPLEVGAYAFVGVGATVLARTGIGAGAVVGAGSVVTKPVLPGQVVTGVPARPIQPKNARPTG